MVSRSGGSDGGRNEPRRSVFTTVDSATLRATVDLQLKDGVSTGELDLLARNGARIEDIGARAVSFALAGLDEGGGYAELGYPTAAMYAERRLGHARTTARERIAAGRSLRELPAVREAFDDERLTWSQVRVIARVATPETDSAWARWAVGRTARETAAHCRRREKGQLPTDPQKRHVHTTKFKVTGLLDVVQLEMWNTARAKVEASRGQPVSDTEMLLEAATILLSLTPDGTAPGWRPVNDAHFKVVVRHDPMAGAAPDANHTTIHTEFGPVPLDDETARAVLHEAGRDDLARTVPAPERDRPTPPALRKKVLDRDGYRCRHCGSKDHLSVDHIRERSCGGPTVTGNLETLDEACHSLKTDGLLKVMGNADRGLRFTDREGRDLHAQGEPTGLKITSATDARASLITFNDLPHDCDAGWWARHEHLLKWNERRHVFEFEPGVALAAAPDARASGPPGDARVSRPTRLADFVGQERVVGSLATMVRVAEQFGRPLPHLLLQGPGGLGKTSLARAVANELGTEFHLLNGPSVTGFSTLLRRLASLRRDGEIVFLDEIHCLPRRVCEAMYDPLEDGRLSVPVACGNRQRTLHVRLPRFTLIGATTDEQLLPRSFRQRLRRQTLDFYTLEEIGELVRRAAAREGLEIDDDATRLIAGASRDTPREALALLSCTCDEARLRSRPTIDCRDVRAALDRSGIDDAGLTATDRRCLEALEAGPLGARTLAGRLGISVGKLVEVVEPFLIRRGLLVITWRGRALSRPHRPEHR